MNLAYVPEANVGDYVVIHVGFAISKLNQAEADEAFRYLKEIEAVQLQEELGAS